MQVQETKTLDIEKVEMEAHSQAMNLAFNDAVKELVDLLGVPLVTMVAGVTNGRWVKDWMDGVRSPKNPGTDQRVRLALQTSLILTADGRSRQVAQAWFQGGNPILDRRAPVMVIREGGMAEAPNVIGAARSFIGT